MESLVPTISLTQLPFAAACEAWLESRRPYISEKTHHEYKLNIRTLASFFGELRLQEIDGDLLRAYQRTRKLKCGSSAINHECGLLCQIRKRIGMPITDYQPLPLSKERVGRVLSDAERLRLTRVASSNAQWEAAYLFAVISVNTTAGPKEVCSLRLKDVNFQREEFYVPPKGAKNRFRARPIPLNVEALDAMKQAIARAARLGSKDPDQYIFPKKIGPRNNHAGSYDPASHQTSFKTAWKKIIEQAMLGGLLMYDLRRTAITTMLEDPEISYQTVQEIAGHTPGSPITKRYSHIRVEARRRAVDSLAPKKPAAMERRSRKRSAKSTERAQLVTELSAVLAKLLKAG
jgi:integrase